jgi:hypothetical protein
VHAAVTGEIIPVAADVLYVVTSHSIQANNLILSLVKWEQIIARMAAVAAEASFGKQPQVVALTQ